LSPAIQFLNSISKHLLHLVSFAAHLHPISSQAHSQPHS
jgi:hypothetical protein